MKETEAEISSNSTKQKTQAYKAQVGQNSEVDCNTANVKGLGLLTPIALPEPKSMVVVIRAEGIKSAKQKLGIINKEANIRLAFELSKLVKEMHLTRQSKKQTLLLDQTCNLQT